VPKGPSRAGRIARRIFSTWLLSKVLAIGLLAGGAWLVTRGIQAPELRVASVTIVGNSLASAPEITEQLDLEGQNVFSVRGPRLERLIEHDPLIQRAHVQPVLPNAVRIAIVERQPAVVWDTGDRQLLTDGTGLALREGIEPLPTVRAPEGPITDPGGRVDADAVHMAQAIGPQLDALGYTGGWLEYRPDRGVTLEGPGKEQVLLGFANDLPAKLAAYRSIRRYLDESHTAVQLVDVRFLDRPYYR
jgi:hypothetical protein